MNYAEKLTRDNAAVILVDFLDGFFPGIKTIDHDLLRRNAEAFARLSKIFDMPTIMLGEEGSFRGEFFPGVVANADHAIRIERHTPSAWDEPNFRKALESIGRKKIILGGISLDICTLQLTLDLISGGYPVETGSEIVRHVVHHLAGEGAQVRHLGGIFGRDDEAEMVPVVFAT
jgi:nicotinamidase-related amidase